MRFNYLMANYLTNALTLITYLSIDWLDQSTLYRTCKKSQRVMLTSSSAIAERPRCRVG